MIPSTRLRDMKYTVVEEAPITNVRRLGIEERGRDPQTEELIYRDHSILVGGDGSVVCAIHGKECAFAIDSRSAEFVSKHRIGGTDLSVSSFIGERVSFPSLADETLDEVLADIDDEMEKGLVMSSVLVLNRLGYTVIKESDGKPGLP